MKIITFWGGLGNQMFEYAYYKWLQERYPNEKIYGFYPSIGLAAHNGLEIDKWFDVTLPPTTKFSNLIGGFLFNLNRLCRSLRLPLIATCTQLNEKYRSIFHCDYWQDKKYLLEQLHLNFYLGCPNDINHQLLSKVQSSNAVAIHIRRGDYLNPNVAKVYGDICTEKYYQKAIAIINASVHKPLFVFFSNDCIYVRDTYHLDNMIVVDWNKGEDSVWDMYLMSKCKYMILANSTFSYWAARLNDNADKIYCPRRWTNCNPPDIIFDNWELI